MATFEYAYFKEENSFIKIEQYIEQQHNGKMFCPECADALLHVVKKTFFRTNPKSKHSEDCQYFLEPLSQKTIKKYNQKERNEVIEIGIRAIERLMHKTRSTTRNKEQEDIKVTGNPKNKNKIFANSITKHIPRIKVDKLPSKEFESGGIYLIYGSADIQKNNNQNENVEIEEKFSLRFKQNNNLKFTIWLNEKVSSYLEWNADKSCNFIVCGILKRNGNYANMFIFNSNHFKVIK